MREASDLPGRFRLGDVLWTQDGQRLTIREVGGTPQRPILAFAELRSREEAENLRGASLWADRLETHDDVVLVADLVGRDVVDQSGTARGRVIAVEANPASELMVLDSGALVPTVFIVGLDDVILVEAPQGLFDL